MVNIQFCIYVLHCKLSSIKKALKNLKSLMNKFLCGIFFTPTVKRFHEVFKTLAESDEGKLHVLRVMFEVWRNHPQVKILIRHVEALII